VATFRKRGSRWQVQIRLQGHAPITKTFTQRADAEAWARQREVAIERGEIESARRSIANLSFDKVTPSAFRASGVSGCLWSPRPWLSGNSRYCSIAWRSLARNGACRFQRIPTTSAPRPAGSRAKRAILSYPTQLDVWSAASREDAYDRRRRVLEPAISTDGPVGKMALTVQAFLCSGTRWRALKLNVS
jgi:hypothetical protein